MAKVASKSGFWSFNLRNIGNNKTELIENQKIEGLYVKYIYKSHLLEW
jgi:hypothetical protein